MKIEVGLILRSPNINIVPNALGKTHQIDKLKKEKHVNEPFVLRQF